MVLAAPGKSTADFTDARGDHAAVQWAIVLGLPLLAALLLWRAGARALRLLLGADDAAPWALPLALGALALTTLPGLGAASLFDRDEGYYAESARGMLERRDFVVPEVAGERWLQKPPLTYWAMMASMAALGRTEFAARLPSVVFGLALVGFAYALGRRLYGAAQGWLAAVLTASSVLVALTMRLALLDASLAACTTLALLGLWHLTRGARRRGFWMFYVACGLGVLAKGPLGAALPVLAAVGDAVATRRLRRWRELAPFRGALLALAVTGLWAVPATIQTDGEYLRELVWERTIKPVFAPLQGHGGGGAGTYLLLLPVYVPVLLGGLGVWAPFLWGAVRAKAADDADRDRRRFLLGATAAQFAALSLVSTKLAHYVLPLVPAVALLIADLIVRELRGDPTGATLWTKGRRRALAAGAALIAVAMLVVPAVLGFAGAAGFFAPASAALAGGTVLVLRHARSGQGRTACTAAAAAVLLSLAWLCGVGLPSLNDGKSAAPLARFLRQRYPPPELAALRIALVDYKQYSLLYYLERSAQKVDRGDLEAFLAAPGPAVAVLDQRDLDAAEAEGLHAPHHVVWRQHSWIADKNRWVDVVAVGNRE